MKRRTVSADDLETLARTAHADIELPGPEGGWATATINGHRYRASVPPVPVEAVEVHKPFTDDGVTYCGWDGHEGCGEAWPCSTIRAGGAS